jgi:Cu2+-exporting ATPase
LSTPTRPNSAEPGAVRSSGHCPHCGAAVEGTADVFCCTGCEVASAIIRGAGLERYYLERTEAAPRPEPIPASDWSAVPVEVTPAGLCEARLVIDGLRCASCVWVTERVLERTPGVDHAMVSYASGRTSVRWDPAQVDLPTLARRIAQLGYRPRPVAVESAPDRSLMVRMGFAAIAAIAIMGLYEGLYAGWWYGEMDPRYAALFRWASLLIATPVALWCAEPYFTGAWRNLRHGLLHMDLPIALGIGITWLHGLVATLLQQDGYLDSLAMLVALLLAGRVLESRGRRRAVEAAAAMVGSVPRTARRVRAEQLEVVAVAELKPGDAIDLGAGEELAADGVVAEGSGQMRMALLTGEAAPVLVGPGDRVVAGTVLVDGALTVQVEAVGDRTVVHQMAAELQAAQDRGLSPDSTDRIAPWFTAATLTVAAATFVGWWLARGMTEAIGNTVAVLVVACPCALALARPLSASAGLAASARRGLLLRSADSLLALARVDIIGLDKTGTITQGALVVTGADDAALRIAAGLERYSVHPVARAITAAASERGIPLPAGSGIRESPGSGISGVVDGQRWMLRSAGAGAVALIRLSPSGTETVAGRIQLGDAIRPDAAEAIRALRAAGLKIALLTGDHGDAAREIGQRSGVDDVGARLDPAAKAAWVRARQAEGQRVLFAGDGLNDGPALAAADVGLAMSSGAASSVLVADGILASRALGPIPAGIRAGRAARRMIRSSQIQSIGYNVLAVAAAVAGLVNPLVAAVLMPLSSIAVIWNAARVERLVRQGD